MGHGRNFSRRTLLHVWLASLGRLWAGTGSITIGLDPVSFTLRGFTPAVAYQRRYRMDATILFLGAPLFTRQAAGGGYAVDRKSVV